ncbi:MAG: hypothetical protein JKY88_13845 [Pseudomonadales bacterium]|nr:hypothetical protein [Pseudomonadales bacterium]
MLQAGRKVRLPVQYGGRHVWRLENLGRGKDIIITAMRYDDKTTDEDVKDLHLKILMQDKPMIESQRPIQVSLEPGAPNH